SHGRRRHRRRGPAAAAAVAAVDLRRGRPHRRRGRPGDDPDRGVHVRRRLLRPPRQPGGMKWLVTRTSPAVGWSSSTTSPTPPPTPAPHSARSLGYPTRPARPERCWAPTAPACPGLPTAVAVELRPWSTTA